MPYDKDGKYYRKPVFNENFKTEKKKPLKKEPHQIKFKKKSVLLGIGAAVAFIGLLAIANGTGTMQTNKDAKRFCNSWANFGLEADYNKCLKKFGFKGKYQRL